VTLADGRTALADADSPEELALLLGGTKAVFDTNISNPNAPIFMVKEAVAMRQALRILALESLVAQQREGDPRRDGLNSDFAKLHEDLAYGDADMLSGAELKAAAGCVLSLMRIQDVLNRTPEWDSETMDAVAAQVRAAGLPLLDADDAASAPRSWRTSTPGRTAPGASTRSSAARNGARKWPTTTPCRATGPG